MPDTSNRWAALRPATGRPDVRGWVVVGADGGKVGTVRELLEDKDDPGARFLAVELDQTTLEQRTVPGGESTITAGAYPPDPNRPGSRPQADVDPSGGTVRQAPPNVLIPFDAGVQKETDQQVVLRTLRQTDLLELPAYSPVPA